MGQPQPQPVNALTLQFLTWVADRPRTRRDVMDAWQSHCPRMSIWEDCVIDGLVKLDSDGTVGLTPRGRAVLRDQESGIRDQVSERAPAS